ncbi:MAG: 16S rRNA (cytidine(1402)-2'-O)-methyltransferase [Proteobacteria bacterium]|jgi:16S rRNA (cytidine1402-2'-O)-methyltransferase|nr:16S rRNA (cytidine(1402)-2'-O)-methyltransferase [Pseudomonadota bacterium]
MAQNSIRRSKEDFILQSNPSDKPGILYVVATPIGNRDDITIRALNILGHVDLVAAEDTRHTGRLLAHHNIKCHMISFHEHNENDRTPDLINRLKAGLSVALVSNAGTPSVSDPGYRLVKEAVINRIRVSPIPGVSAAIAALSVSGLPTDSFVFIGFPAKKKAKRLDQLKDLEGEGRTMVFYESPRRILTFLKEIITVMGDRYGVLSREMTKLHEEFIRGFLSEILSSLNARSAIKGECTLLLTGCEENKEISMKTVRTEIIKALEKKQSKLSDLAKVIAKNYGLPKNKVYDEALKLKRKMQSQEHDSN